MLSRSRCEGTVKAEILVGELILALLAVPFQSAKIYSTLIVYSAHAQKIVALSVQPRCLLSLCAAGFRTFLVVRASRMSILNYFSREENVPGLPSVESTPELRCKVLSAANKRVGEQYLRQEELRRNGFQEA